MVTPRHNGKIEMTRMDYHALQEIAMKTVDGIWSMSIREIVTRAYLAGIAHAVRVMDKEKKR